MDDGDGDIDRYEQLRRRVLDGEPSGWRLGLGVLSGRGMAAWLRVWHTTTVAAAQPQPAVAAPIGSHEVVGVLAAMACLDGR